MSEVVTNCGELPFNLSSKINTTQSCGEEPCIIKADVKEFIRLLKEKGKRSFICGSRKDLIKEFENLINSIAGEELK